MLTIRWTQSARDDLKEIASHIQQDDSEASQRVFDAILKAGEAQAQFPRACRPGKVAGTREKIMTRYPYVLVLKECGEYLDVLRIIHSSRRWPDPEQVPEIPS